MLPTDLIILDYCYPVLGIC